MISGALRPLFRQPALSLSRLHRAPVRRGLRTVSVNGEYLPENEATVSIFDRGFLFADAVYEVTAVIGGKLVDWPGHKVRLDRSLAELGISHPKDHYGDLLDMHRVLVERNRLDEGLVYLQASRGAADRDFLPPTQATPPTLVLFTQEKRLVDSPAALAGIRVCTLDDLRWRRRDIKTVQLLWASMAKMEAQAAGVDDAWMVEDGLVTEGTSNNAYIVSGGAVVTRQLSNDILHGITRAAVLEVASELGLSIEERPFTVAEAQTAAEAFSTSATNLVQPVVEIDGALIGNGKPGPVATELRKIYIEKSIASAI